MSAERDVLREIFHAALERPTADRAAFLADACADDEALRAEVESLLSAHQQADGFLEGRARVTDPMIGRRIGSFTVRSVIGSGGMGVVYEAEQDRPRRTVALKLMRAGQAGTRGLDRFLQEAEVLGRLTHPAIARVYDAGTLAEGEQTLPYMSIEYVQNGLGLVNYAQQHQLSLEQRLGLLVTVCDAVQHGHQRGVIHRDLKPDNVLVDDSGQPKVIDYGVARLVVGGDVTAAAMTQTGQLVGTILYMSPEQCGSGAEEVDTRSDIYALGVLMFELLTGALPFPFEHVNAYEVPRLIRETTPRRAGDVDSQLRGDLETIIAKAMHREPARRYQTAHELAEDLRRFLDGEPIAARRDSRVYILRKTLQRYRLATSVVALFLLLATASSVGLAVLYSRAETRAEALRRSSYANNITLAQHALDSGNVLQLQQLLNGCPVDLRGWEWDYLRWRMDDSQRTLPITAASTLDWLNPDELVVGGKDSRLTLIAAEGGAVLAQTELAGGEVRLVQCREGRTAFVDARSAGLWAPPDPVRRPGETLNALSADLRPDSTQLAIGTEDGSIVLWDSDGDTVRRIYQGQAGIYSLRWLDAQQLIAGDEAGRVTRIAVPGEQVLVSAKLHGDCVSGLAIDHERGLLYTSSWDLSVGAWQLEDLARVHRFAETSAVDAISLTHDGRKLLAAHLLGLSIWDLPTGTRSAQLRGHTHGFLAAQFHPTAQRLASAGNEGRVKLWDPCETHEPWSVEHPSWLTAVTCGERWLVSADHAGQVRATALWSGGISRAWKLDAPVVALLPNEPVERVLVVTSPGGVIACSMLGGDPQRWLALDGILGATKTGEKCLLLMEDGRVLQWTPHRDDRPHELFKSPGARCLDVHGGRVAIGKEDGGIETWSLGGVSTRHVVGHDASVSSIAWSEDGTKLLSCSADATARTWNADLTPIRTLRGHQAPVLSGRFFASDQRIVTGSFDGTLRIWDTRTGLASLSLDDHPKAVNVVDVSPDGSLVVSGSDDHTARIWPTRRVP